MSVIYALQDFLGEAMSTNMLVFAALAIFIVIVAAGAAASYAIACGINKKTELTGMVQMGVSLNEWPSNAHDTEGTRLNLGEFIISMRDPESVTKDRLDPKLTFMQKAYCRRYWVGDLLQRYYENYCSAGLKDDPSGILLRELLKETGFCIELGRIFRRSRKKGLQVYRCECWEQDKKNINKVSIYLDIPESLADTYWATAGCKAKKFCITLRYHSRNLNKAEV